MSHEQLFFHLALGAVLAMMATLWLFERLTRAQSS
jgi:hypothetical protein